MKFSKQDKNFVPYSTKLTEAEISIIASDIADNMLIFAEHNIKEYDEVEE